MNASMKEQRERRAQLLRGVLLYRSSHGDNAARYLRATVTAFVWEYHEAGARSSRASFKPLGREMVFTNWSLAYSDAW